MFRKTILTAVFAVFCSISTAVQSQTVTLESGGFRCVLGSQGNLLGFFDRVTGIDYLDRSVNVPFARVTRGGKDYPVTAMSRSGRKISLGFSGAGSSAILRVQDKGRYLLI